jgi:hypothetical protein
METQPQLPPHPLTIGFWVKLSLLGHGIAYGRIVELQPLITLYQPAVEGGILYQPTPAKLAPYGYGAVYGPIEISTEEAAIKWLTSKREHKPVEWTPEYLMPYSRVNLETAQMMIRIHAVKPELPAYTCERSARGVFARIEDGIAEEVAFEAETKTAEEISF